MTASPSVIPSFDVLRPPAAHSLLPLLISDPQPYDRVFEDFETKKGELPANPPGIPCTDQGHQCSMHIPLCCLDPGGPVECPCSTAEEVHALPFSMTIFQYLRNKGMLCIRWHPQANSPDMSALPRGSGIAKTTNDNWQLTFT